MHFARFFVTAVALIGSLSSVACSTKESQKEKDLTSLREKNNKALVAEGEQLLTRSDAIRRELEETFKIIIADEKVKLAPKVFARPAYPGQGVQLGSSIPRSKASGQRKAGHSSHEPDPDH